MKDRLRAIILLFLTIEAKAVLRRHRPRIIVMTGSVGKTSTKDAAFSALKKKLFVRKSEKSYNSDIGVPLTILGVPNGWSNFVIWLTNLYKGLMLILTRIPYPQWLVIEVGADRPGDISRSLSWVRPHVVVATRFPEVPVHVEFYESPQAVVKEELFPLSLLEEGGIAVLNADDPHTKLIMLREGVKRISYGFSREADVRGSRYRLSIKNGLVSGISFDVVYHGAKVHVTLPTVVGMSHAYTVLGGIGTALAAGLTLEEAAEALKEHTTPPGRLRVIPGKGKSILIDDSYNSSPAAVEEALHALKAVPPSGKRIAVLGDMLELGAYSAKEHHRMGQRAADCVDILVTLGVRAHGIAEGAREAGMTESRVQVFERPSDAISFLLSFVGEGDTVLIKGSQGMRMERIVKALMLEPQHAAELLPRQDPEWLARQ